MRLYLRTRSWLVLAQGSSVERYHPEGQSKIIDLQVLKYKHRRTDSCTIARVRYDRGEISPHTRLFVREPFFWNLRSLSRFGPECRNKDGVECINNVRGPKAAIGSRFALSLQTKTPKGGVRCQLRFFECRVTKMPGLPTQGNQLLEFGGRSRSPPLGVSNLLLLPRLVGLKPSAARSNFWTSERRRLLLAAMSLNAFGEQEEDSNSGYHNGGGVDPQNSKRTAYTGQWRTPPMPLYPSSTTTPPSLRDDEHDDVTHAFDNDDQLGAPWSDKTEDYAAALQDAYRRGAQAALEAAQHPQQQPLPPGRAGAGTGGASVPLLSSASCPEFQLPRQYARTTAAPQPILPAPIVPNPLAPQQQQEQQQMAPPPPQSFSGDAAMPPPPPVVTSHHLMGPPIASHHPVQVPGLQLVTPLTSPTPPHFQAGAPVIMPPQMPPTPSIRTSPVLSSASVGGGGGRPPLAPPPHLRSSPPSSRTNTTASSSTSAAMRAASLPDFQRFRYDPEDEKRQKRLARNRASARLRRLRKKNLVRHSRGYISPSHVCARQNTHSSIVRSQILVHSPSWSSSVPFLVVSQVEAYEVEVTLMERTLESLKKHEWGRIATTTTDGVGSNSGGDVTSAAALIEALSMDRGQQPLTEPERRQAAVDLLDQQLEFLAMLEEELLEQSVLYRLNEHREDDAFKELHDVLQLSDEQYAMLAEASVGWDDEWHAVQTLQSSLRAMRDSDWLWSAGAHSIVHEFVSILGPNQLSKFLLWTDHNSDAIDDLDGVNAAPSSTSGETTPDYCGGPIFQFGVSSNPDSLLDGSGKSGLQDD